MDRMKRINHLRFQILLILSILVIFVRPSDAAQTGVAERGKFRIYKLQYPVGEETYEVTREGDAEVLRAKFEINYLGGDVSLTASLATGAGLAPLRFDIKGQTSTRSELDASVVFTPRAAHVREGGQTRTLRVVDERLYASGGLLPVSLLQPLARYYYGGKTGGALRTFPSGSVSFGKEGNDHLEVGGRRVTLGRYTVRGLVWGRATLWLEEPSMRLVAVVSPDAELDRLEAVREGYEQLLPYFVSRAAADAVHNLFQTSQNDFRPVRSGRYAIAGATLFDGTSDAAVKDSVVLVAGGRIVAVGPRASVRIPKGVPVFDARGKTVLPGLWDMHAHAEQAEWIPASLAAGITTMRDAGNEPEFILPLRDAIRRGKVLGPRLLLAGIIDSPPHALGNNVASTPEEARAVVRRYRRDGYEQVKIYQSLKPELVRVVSEEAHRLGMTVTGHVPTGMSAYEFVEAGADQVNHVGFLLRAMRGRDWRPTPGTPPPPIDLDSPQARDAIRFFKERGTVVDPTLARGELNGRPLGTPFSQVEPGAAKAPPELSSILDHTGLPAEVAPRAAASAALAARLTVLLVRAGVPVVAGTDLVVPGHTIYRELELYVRAGMTPAEAIRTATAVPARVMGLDRELGTIEAGKVADLVIVDGDPLANISDLRRVTHVVTGGRVYLSAPLWQSVGFRPFKE